ncbi:MAG: DUF908 domain-containing protein [Brasilonema angustatum HA4187-MV1]|jgi:hypothetical protein|nr:DUF908 domain-containing protein [Brasilonema angustatum HA4187-MV1]
MTQFSTIKKQLLAMKYVDQLSELIRAYQYGSSERVFNLLETSDFDDIRNSDKELLVALAQDFVAVYELMGYRQTPPIQELADTN